MIIINLFFHLMFMQCLIMAKGMYPIFRLQRELIIKWITPPGTDISRYKNIPVQLLTWPLNQTMILLVAMSMIHKAGFLHVANHHVSPGKKQWTWGNGDFGHAWDRNLTDEDGPYIELMTGVFTDNQPDFSWLQPNEEKTFKQYFMPYSELGVVKNATKEAHVNLEVKEGNISIKFFATAEYQNATAILVFDNHKIWSEKISISPASPFHRTVPFNSDISLEKISITLYDAHEKILVSYRPEVEEKKEVPLPARPAEDPAVIESTEQLFLTGLHIEQYRHATYKATDYYEEALRRDPGDARNNNAMGSMVLETRSVFNSGTLLY